jgi:lipoate-protein ligase A
MKWFDFTFATPAENLACDEALLDLCERDGLEVLRFWESREPFVVVGYGNRVESEVNVEECKRRGVPILRRCSGGGTVVQGPGCLNYNLALRIPDEGPLTSVTGTNEFVMERNRAALEKL